MALFVGVVFDHNLFQEIVVKHCYYTPGWLQGHYQVQIQEFCVLASLMMMQSTSTPYIRWKARGVFLDYSSSLSRAQLNLLKWSHEKTCSGIHLWNKRKCSPWATPEPCNGQRPVGVEGSLLFLTIFTTTPALCKCCECKTSWSFSDIGFRSPAPCKLPLFLMCSSLTCDSFLGREINSLDSAHSWGNTSGRTTEGCDLCSTCIGLDQSGLESGAGLLSSRRQLFR